MLSIAKHQAKLMPRQKQALQMDHTGSCSITSGLLGRFGWAYGNAGLTDAGWIAGGFRVDVHSVRVELMMGSGLVLEGA